MKTRILTAIAAAALVLSLGGLARAQTLQQKITAKKAEIAQAKKDFDQKVKDAVAKKDSTPVNKGKAIDAVQAAGEKLKRLRKELRDLEAQLPKPDGGALDGATSTKDAAPVQEAPAPE